MLSTEAGRPGLPGRRATNLVGLAVRQEIEHVTTLPLKMEEVAAVALLPAQHIAMLRLAPQISKVVFATPKLRAPLLVTHSLALVSRATLVTERTALT